MKYIAIFDLPEGYKMGCACGKMISAEKRKQEVLNEEDFENAYANIQPLSEQQAEVFEKFTTVDRVLSELGLSNAYDMPSFWTKNKDYKVILTKYHQGYMQALEDVEKEIRKRFGFSERENVIMPPPFH